MSRPIYHKSVKELFKDLLNELGISRGNMVSRKQIHDWFRQKYPLIKDGTVSAHLVLFTTNSRARINHNVDPMGKHDLFYQIDRSNFRKFNPGVDPKPIYIGETNDARNNHTQTVKPKPPEKGNKFANKDERMNDILHELRRILESIKPEPKHVSLNDYINELTRQCYIPNRIAGLMHAIRRMRNDFIKGRVKLSDDEFAAIEANWLAIKTWASR